MKDFIYSTIYCLFIAEITFFLFFLASRDHQLNTFSMLLSYFWILPLPIALITLYGILRYGTPKIPKQSIEVIQSKMIYRIVTRGFNHEAVWDTVKVLDKELHYFFETTGNISEIEVVSDNPLPLPDTLTRLKLILVPSEYKTTNDTRFKARALHFALTNSDAVDEDFLVHLDEETRLTQHTLFAITHFLVKHKDNPTVIGQGPIEYTRTLKNHFFQTLADSIRVADDLGRFRVQFKAGKCLFGMKGSYIVILNALEKHLGFDIGPKNSITEDAFFALKAGQQGYRFDYIEGFMHEQSPFSVADFLKQRERWFKGLWLVLQDRELKLKTKITLLQSIILWTLSPLVVFATIQNLFIPSALPDSIRVLGNLTFACYVFFYLYGFIASVEFTTEKISAKQSMYYAALQIILIPAFSILETAAVIKAFTNRAYAFHVVKK